MKKKSQKTKSSFSGSGLSTLGEALKQANPELARKIEAIQESINGADRLVEVIHDHLPYNWADPERFDEGVRLAAEGEYADAMELLDEVLRYSPDAYPACHMQGFVLGCLRNYKEEAENYRKAIKICSDYPQVYFDLGIACGLMGKEKRAFAAFQLAAPLAPDFAVIDYWLSFTFERMDRFRSEGGQGRKRFREKNLVMAQACYMLGKAYVEERMHTPARHAFKKAALLFPEFAEAYYQIGALHIKKLRNPKRAAKYLEKAEKLFLKRNDFHRASMAHQLYHPVEEVKEREKAADDWLKEGLRLQQMGMYLGSVDAYNMAVELKPDFLDAYYNMAVAYGSLEDRGVPLIHKAIGVFKRVLGIKPDFVHALIGLGAAHIKNKEPDEAIRYLLKAVEYDPLEPNGPYYVGIAHRMAGRSSEAVEYFKQAVQLSSDSTQILFQLGLALLEARRYQEACDRFHEVLRIKPDFADAHFVLGNLYLDQIPETEKAVSHLRKAEKLFARLEDFHRAAQVRQALSPHVD